MSELCPRINIGTLARQVADPETILSDALPATKGVKSDSEAAYAIYNQIKEELYAISAVVADMGIKDALTTFDLDSCIDYIGTVQPFIRLEHYTKLKLRSVLAAQHRRISRNHRDPMYSRYRRLAHLVMLEHQLIPNARPEHDIEGYYRQGIKTNSLVMSNSLGVVSELVGRENSDRAISVADNSFPFIAMLSSSHTEAFKLVMPELYDKSKDYNVFDPRFFAIKPDVIELKERGQVCLIEPERLEFSEEGEAVVARVLKGANLKNYRSDSSATAGCIAMAMIEGSSGIKLLWEKHVDIGRRLYPLLAVSKTRQ